MLCCIHLFMVDITIKLIELQILDTLLEDGSKCCILFITYRVKLIY